MSNQHQRRRQSRHRSYSPPPSPSLHSMSSSSRNDTPDTPSTPRHPVPSMQAAFEESILDLEEASESSSWRGPRVRHRPEYHRLLKVVSQIAFGIHLLHARLAKSDPEVVRILQSHVDDMDFFIAATTSDFELARSDIGQRLKHLRIPLDSGRASEVFDQMLENREFRLEIVKGNENVEYVISRTAAAMKSALVDVKEGLSAVDELAKYLLGLKKGWKNTNLIRVYAAMTLNVEQWFRGLVLLQTKGTGLKEDLEQLRRVVREIEQRTGAASRKNRASIAVLSNKKSCPALTANINKPLPTPPTPDSVLTAIDIRPAKRSRSRPRSMQAPPAIIVTDENQPPGRTPSQQKRTSQLRARPVPEMWPEPLSLRNRDLVEEVQEDYVFNPDKAEVGLKAPKEKRSRRPESCVIM